MLSLLHLSTSIAHLLKHHTNNNNNLHNNNNNNMNTNHTTCTNAPHTNRNRNKHIEHKRLSEEDEYHKSLTANAGDGETIEADGTAPKATKAADTR